MRCAIECKHCWENNILWLSWCINTIENTLQNKKIKTCTPTISSVQKILAYQKSFRKLKMFLISNSIYFVPELDFAFQKNFGPDSLHRYQSWVLCSFLSKNITRISHSNGLAKQKTLLQVIYNPITAMGFSVMFTF